MSSPGRPGHAPPPGAAPLGLLADLAPLERALVIALRRWCSGGATAAEFAAGLRRRLGPTEGGRAIDGLDGFLRHCLGQSRRRFVRHALDCPCFGADEAWLADLVALSAAGDRAGAAALAREVLPEEALDRAVDLAEDLGLALDRTIGPSALEALLRHRPKPPATERTT